MSHTYYKISRNRLEVSKKIGGLEVQLSFSKSKYCGFWQCPKIAWLHIAWKAGRFTQQMLEAEEKVPPLNGRGKTITNLDQFLDDVNKNRIIDESIQDYDERARFAIEKLYELKDKYNVGQMGSVYLIAILFFLSGGEYPVYDKYAHTAVKALFLIETQKMFSSEKPLREQMLWIKLLECTANTVIY